MLGNNTIRSPSHGDGHILAVQEIFKTFQGEGPYTGWPAIFIRLGGCNLACHFCDTEFDTDSSWVLEDILTKVTMFSKNNKNELTHPLIVLTGGEPLRQPLEALCKKLLSQGYKIQIETNGTLFRPLPKEVEIICSPKNTGSGYHPLRPDLLPYITAVKFIISATNPLYQNCPDLGQKKHNIPVYLQPMDEYQPTKNSQNYQYTLNLAEQHGYRISLQTHKIWNIP